MENALVVHDVASLEKMAKAFAESGLFGIKTVPQGIALMLIAQAEGLHPAVAARDYDIIQGRPALKARAMLGRFQASGGKLEWIERSDTAAEAQFSHPCSPKPISVRWDMERAKTAGLGGKENWKKFPRQMLSARVISEGVAACYPMATSGLYVPEEIEDFDQGFQKAKPANEPRARESAKNAMAQGMKDSQKNEEKKPGFAATEDAQVIEPETAKDESPKPAESKTMPEQPKTQPAPPNAKADAPAGNSAGEIAAEIAKIRKLGAQLNLKSMEDFSGVVSGLAGRKIERTTDLTNDERKKVIAGMEDMTKEPK